METDDQTGEDFSEDDRTGSLDGAQENGLALEEFLKKVKKDSLYDWLYG